MERETERLVERDRKNWETEEDSERGRERKTVSFRAKLFSPTG